MVSVSLLLFLKKKNVFFGNFKRKIILKNKTIKNIYKYNDINSKILHGKLTNLTDIMILKIETISNIYIKK